MGCSPAVGVPNAAGRRLACPRSGDIGFVTAEGTRTLDSLEVCVLGLFFFLPLFTLQQISLSTRLRRVNNDVFVVTLTKERCAYPTQPSPSKHMRAAQRLPSRGRFVRVHSTFQQKFYPCRVLPVLFPVEEVICTWGRFWHLGNS